MRPCGEGEEKMKKGRRRSDRETDFYCSSFSWDISREYWQQLCYKRQKEMKHGCCGQRQHTVWESLSTLTVWSREKERETEGERISSSTIKNGVAARYKRTSEKTCCFVMGISVWAACNYERQVNQVNHSFLWSTCCHGKYFTQQSRSSQNHTAHTKFYKRMFTRALLQSRCFCWGASAASDQDHSQMQAMANKL